MPAEILTARQKLFLAQFAAQPLLSKKFYLTGGTALAGFICAIAIPRILIFFPNQNLPRLRPMCFLNSSKQFYLLKIGLSADF